MPERLITVAASGFFQPILDLCERMVQRPRQPVVASRVAFRDNGYALSVVLLAVVMFESFIGRVSDLQGRPGASGRTIRPRESVPDYLIALRKSFPLEKSLIEVFVLRNAIAHGHVWSLTVSPHATRGSVLREAKLGAAYGNAQHRLRVNPNTRRTRALGLHVVPSAVGRDEVVKVLGVIHRVLLFLVGAKLLEPNVIAYHGRFQSRPFDFWRVIEVVDRAA